VGFSLTYGYFTSYLIKMLEIIGFLMAVSAVNVEPTVPVKEFIDCWYQREESEVYELDTSYCLVIPSDNWDY